MEKDWRRCTAANQFFISDGEQKSIRRKSSFIAFSPGHVLHAVHAYVDFRGRGGKRRIRRTIDSSEWSRSTTSTILIFMEERGRESDRRCDQLNFPFRWLELTWNFRWFSMKGKGSDRRCGWLIFNFDPLSHFSARFRRFSWNRKERDRCHGRLIFHFDGHKSLFTAFLRVISTSSTIFVNFYGGKRRKREGSDCG